MHDWYPPLCHPLYKINEVTCNVIVDFTFINKFVGKQIVQIYLVDLPKYLILFVCIITAQILGQDQGCCYSQRSRKILPECCGMYV